MHLTADELNALVSQAYKDGFEAGKKEGTVTEVIRYYPYSQPFTIPPYQPYPIITWCDSTGKEG